MSSTGIKGIDSLKTLLHELKRLREIGQMPEPVWVSRVLEDAATTAVKDVEEHVRDH